MFFVVNKVIHRDPSAIPSGPDASFLKGFLLDHISKYNAAGNFIFRNPARDCTITIAYCVNNLQCISYFLLKIKK